MLIVALNLETYFICYYRSRNTYKIIHGNSQGSGYLTILLGIPRRVQPFDKTMFDCNQQISRFICGSVFLWSPRATYIMMLEQIPKPRKYNRGQHVEKCYQIWELITLQNWLALIYLKRYSIAYLNCYSCNKWLCSHPVIIIDTWNIAVKFPKLKYAIILNESFFAGNKNIYTERGTCENVNNIVRHRAHTILVDLTRTNGQ